MSRQAEPAALAATPFDAGDRASLAGLPQHVICGDRACVHHRYATQALFLQPADLALDALALADERFLVGLPPGLGRREALPRFVQRLDSLLGLVYDSETGVVEAATTPAEDVYLVLEVGELLWISDAAAVEPVLEGAQLRVEVLELGVDLALPAADVDERRFRDRDRAPRFGQGLRLAEAGVDVSHKRSTRVQGEVDFLQAKQVSGAGHQASWAASGGRGEDEWAQGMRTGKAAPPSVRDYRLARSGATSAALTGLGFRTYADECSSTMLFNVSGLVLEGIGATRKYPVSDVFETTGGETERVEGEVEFIRTPSGVLARVYLRLVDPEVCSRCLRPFDREVPIEFEEEFHATTDPRTGGSLPPPEDRDAFVIDSNHTLDLSEAVRQYREVSLEIQPLCRPDCRGLCPTCGKDLNLGDCDCEPVETESPWSKLAGLRGAGQEGKE